MSPEQALARIERLALERYPHDPIQPGELLTIITLASPSQVPWATEDA